MSESKSADEDGDPVVKEIPVYFSKTLAEKLFVLKYPLRSAQDGYDNAVVLKSSIKPQNQEIQIEVALNTHSVNYDQFKGEQIAINANVPSRHDKEEEERYFESDLMDKVVLQSSRSVPSNRNIFAVGVYQDGDLHLTPLKGILEMRPAFQYFDKQDKRSKDDNKDAEIEEEEEPAKQVNVSFARQKPDHIKKLQEQSFKCQTNKSFEESWIHTKYIPATNSKAELSRMEMLCPPVDDAMNSLNMSKKDFLKNLLPPAVEEPLPVVHQPNYVTSLNYIRTLPLLEQIRYLMKDAKVMNFSELKNTLSTEHETSMILKYLQQVAVLVQGNWIINSELIYPKDTKSHQNGIPAELMCRARDFVLSKFTESQYIDRRAVSSAVKLPSEEIAEILKNLGQHQYKKGWHLVRSPDLDFSKRFPEIAQRQEIFWEAKKKHLHESMEVQMTHRQRRRSNRESVGSESEEKSTGRGRKSLRDSSMSDNDSTTETVKHKKTNKSKKSSEAT